MMTPVAGNSRAAFFGSKLVYHAGRLITYAMIGTLFGLIGESLVFAGVQRWLSLLVGSVMLLAIFIAGPLKSRLTKIPLFVKSLFGRFIHKRTYGSIFTLGATNGLLPCGLVYIAATSSIATGNIAGSVAYMVFFGLGTLPILLSISYVGRAHAFLKLPNLQKLVPATIALVGVLLIIRSQPISLLTHGSERAKCAACSK
jgi:uncharacterized protein